MRRKNIILGDFWGIQVGVRFCDDFGHVLAPFWNHFGPILGWFLEAFCNALWIAFGNVFGKCGRSLLMLANARVDLARSFRLVLAQVQHAMLGGKMGPDGLKMALKALKTCLGSG